MGLAELIAGPKEARGMGHRLPAEWTSPDKAAPVEAGHYWGIRRVVTDVVAVYHYDGRAWRGGTPFYYWPCRLPLKPPIPPGISRAIDEEIAAQEDYDAGWPGGPGDLFYYGDSD